MDNPKDSEDSYSSIQGTAQEEDSASTSITSISSEALSPNDQPAVDPDSLRGTVGAGMDRFSHLINDNLSAARYGVFAGVTLLTVYGLSQTPLFFRYRTVSDVPASSFIGRRRLYGRIIGVNTLENGSGSAGDIQIHVRHLSPIGQILPKSWFDFLVKFSPQASRLGNNASAKPEENSRQLLKVKIAGIHPPPVSGQVYRPEQFLDRLARDRTLVSCQLLARQVDSTSDESHNKANKRAISEVMPELSSSPQRKDDNDTSRTRGASQTDYQQQELAICRVTYRPTLFQLFPTDIAEQLIATGNATVSSSILGSEATSSDSTSTTTRSTIDDSSQRLQDLRSDVKYLDRLAKAEFEAARKAMGMWSVPEVRERKREVVDEIEFQAKANVLQKLWRWVRGD